MEIYQVEFFRYWVQGFEKIGSKAYLTFGQCLGYNI